MRQSLPMLPRVTVIIPTYNWSSVLPYSIGSVLRQTMADFELLVVGDGCTDDSERVVAGIDDSRVRWINLPANTRHQCGPNNEGLRQARGGLIAYLGHDDLWLPHHLAALVSAIDQSGADITHSLVACVDPDGDVWPVTPWPEHGAWGPPSCIVHRRRVSDALGGWRDYRDINVEPETDLLRRARQAGFRFTLVPRLTAIKFPASTRRGVYQSRPCHEQAEWSARIESEPDFEAVQLARLIVHSREAKGTPYRELVRQLIDQTLFRLRRRVSARSKYVGLLWRRRRAGLDEVRRFKGL
jgi:glycosyltransferase involved in cell wall biosynthesis